ncbi:MAG: squalene synthase HpnC [Burkholderiaceae bacterium]
MRDSNVRDKTTTLAHGVDHYENFPVASLLCPAALRPVVTALYHFARTADDLADEGDASPDERLKQLAAYRKDLDQALNNATPSDSWRPVFQPLAKGIRQHQLPGNLLHDLISAFEQDVRYTAAGHQYQSTRELLDYCKLSANPVGRLLLHLYGIDADDALAQSDHICSALQLINFWQDISVDLPRQRHYLTSDCLQRHRLERAHFEPGVAVDAATELRRRQAVAELCQDARKRMLIGAPLVRRIPGRSGWELRLVVQGGLRILDKIEAVDHRTWAVRPTLSKRDAPGLLWRALRMR